MYLPSPVLSFYRYTHLQQKNNLFNCDAPILELPRVPLLRQWRGSPLSQQAARQLFIGHYACEEAHSTAQRLPWSWKIVCGANPAYDAFPAQHQIFYPSAKSANALWYDPVFKVRLDTRRSLQRLCGICRRQRAVVAVTPALPSPPPPLPVPLPPHATSLHVTRGVPTAHTAQRAADENTVRSTVAPTGTPTATSTVSSPMSPALTLHNAPLTRLPPRRCQVETLDGRSVWTKRHYRCMPRSVASDLAGEDGSSAGAWTLTTLDNGVVSKEHWTTVDAADDLSWAVFHYSGAAAVVGQSYLGALLCSTDGAWPAGADYGRIAAAFRRYDPAGDSPSLAAAAGHSRLLRGALPVLLPRVAPPRPCPASLPRVLSPHPLARHTLGHNHL